MNDILKALYHAFYTPLKLEALRQEMESCHQQLINRLDKPERKLVLRIIDNGNQIAETLSMDSFICGYQVAQQTLFELGRYSSERPVLENISTQDAHIDSPAERRP